MAIDERATTSDPKPHDNDVTKNDAPPTYDHDEVELKSYKVKETRAKITTLIFVAAMSALIIGVLLIAMGFANTHTSDIALKVSGVAFVLLSSGLVVAFGFLSYRSNESYDDPSIALRERVALFAAAMDVIQARVVSQQDLNDAGTRRLLLQKLREQRTIDNSESRRTSRVSGRQPNFVPMNSTDMHHPSSVAGSVTSPSLNKVDLDKVESLPDVPGIQISRFETLDQGSEGKGSVRYDFIGRQYAVFVDDNEPHIYSGVPRYSCQSDISLTNSRSSRSRSSNASSRMFDFSSPRDSEWDADVSLGSRESQLNISKHDWGGGPSVGGDIPTGSSTSNRKLAVVTFATGDGGVRRHSSPTPVRRKECEEQRIKRENEEAGVLKGVLVNNGQRKYLHQDDGQCGGRTSSVSAYRKRSMEIQALRSTIEEDEPEEEDLPSNRSSRLFQTSPALQRTNTDDSEVERRMTKLFKDIELSADESADEAKSHMCNGFCIYRRIETTEVSVQTEVDLHKFLDERLDNEKHKEKKEPRFIGITRVLQATFHLGKDRKVKEPLMKPRDGSKDDLHMNSSSDSEHPHIPPVYDDVVNISMV